jgi:hypothetical protein
MKKIILCLGFCAVLFVLGCQKPAVFKSSVGKKLFWNFETDPAGSLPPGWLVAQSGDMIPSGVWQVENDSWGNALALVQSTNTGQTCNLLLATGSSIANVNLSVRLRVTGGRESQSAGLIWRVLDKDNYYLACWDMQEKTLRLGYVEAGRMTLLRSIYVQADPANWHILQVENFRDTIRIAMDDVIQMEFQDDTLRYPGMIGLVTQADSRAMFDDIRVQEIQRQGT